MGGADELFGSEQETQSTGADDLFAGEEQQVENRLKFIADETVNETPERASRSIEIMKRTGISKKFIDDNFDEIDRAARQSEFDAKDFLQKSPKVADWMLKNPDYATLIKEDRESMTAMEQILTTEAKARQWGEAKVSRGPAPSVESVLSGIGTSFTEGFVKAKAGAQLQFADVIGSEQMFTQASRAYEQSVGREARATPEIENTLGRWTYGGAANTVRMIPSIAAAVITKNPSLGLAVIGGEMQPETYAKYRTRGGTKGEAFAGAAAETTVEIAMELIPMKFIVDNIGKAGMGSFLSGFLGRELPTELVAEISQSAIDTAVANPDKTWKQFVAELPETIGQTVTATLMMAGGMTLTNEALKRAAGKEQGPLTEEFFKALGENSTNSKLRERLPDSYQEIIKDLTKDGPVENVYAPVEFFQSHFQEQGIDPRQIATELGFERQYDEALNTGGKIAIPTAVYAKNLAPTEHNAVFAKELSFAPDQMSSRETEEFLKEADKEKEPETDTFRESLTQAMTPIREQLKEIYPADVADKNAAVIEARLRSRATRLGIDPQKLMKQRPLEITESGEATGAELMQKIKIPKKLYRGISKGMQESGVEGTGVFSLGKGMYSSADKSFAAKYGEVIEVSPDKAFPRNPLILTNVAGGAPQAFMDWALKETGLKNAREFNKKYPDPGVFVREKGYDGIVAGDEIVKYETDLFQEGQDIKRGSISVSPTGDVIRLFQAKNLSTLLHELSHRWLFEMQDDASLPGAPQQIKDDLAATLKYLGVESIEELDITKIEKGTEAYAKAVAANEKFAETGEAYLMEGKAPSIALRRVFAHIRAWLVAVYKSLKQGRLDVEMTPEMRGVFDRLLATDQEIEAAKAEANAVPIFTTSVDAGMTDTEFSAYRKTIEDANREEREELDAKVMNEYKKTLTDIWKEEKTKVQAEVEAELDIDPVYAAMRKMKENNVKIARSEAGSLPRSLTAKDGIPADMAAEMLGFTSGESLVKALASVEPRGARATRETNIRMDQRFGNLLTDGTLVEEARKTVMGDGRAKIIEAEIKALNKKAREVKPFVKANEKAQAEEARAGRDLYKALVPKLADVREHAATVISGKPIRELRPMQYYNTARQASREAVRDVDKKDYLMAGYNKGRELLNLELYREANNAIDQVEKHRKYLQKFDKDSSRKKMRGEFLVQIDDILERFDLRRRSLTAIDKEKESLVDFVEKEAERLSAVVPDIAPSILNERYRKNYKEMTVEEMTGVVAAVKQLEALARREHEQYMAIRKMNFEQERTAIIDRLREFNPKHFDDEGNVIPIKPDFVPDASKAAKKLGDKFAGEFLNTETILNILEGGSFGQVEQSLFGRMSDRSNWKATRLEGLYKKLKPLFNQYSLVEKQQFGRKDIGIGMTRENAVVVALLNGNKEGKERLNNYGFDEAQIQRIIGHMDQRDWNLVNGIWDIFDQDLWPELKALNERTRGQAPPKVEAVPFQTRFGEQKGGYFTLKYDTELDERAHSFDETKAVKDLLGGSMGISAKTNQGTSTKRLEGVKLRPRLDLNVFSEAVNETVHDLAYREAVADSMKLLNDPDIRDSIKAIAGTPAYRALVTRIRETAAPPRNPSGFIEKALTIARKNTIVTILSGVRTALLNITGAVSVYTRSFEKASPVSAGLLTRELGKFYSWRMAEMYEFATTHSEYMRHRFNNFDRDLQDMANKLTVKGKILPDTSQFLWLMGMTDRGVTVPVWNASFAEGMKRYKNDTKQAVEYADHIVRQTQGSGRDVDLAKIMSGHGGWGQLKKVFTMFQSFFIGQLGQLVRSGAISAREAENNRAEAVAKFTARFILIVSIPAAIATIGGRDDDDMDENWFKKFAYVNIMYIAAMFPLVRDMASYTWSKFDKSVANYGLKLSPVQSAGEGVAKGMVAAKDIVKGEGTKKDIKDLIMGVSYAVGLPGKLISDVVLGTNAYLEGDKGPEAVIFGPGVIRQ